MRDMTRATYKRKLRTYGFGEVMFWGYRSLPKPYDSMHVSELNGGDTYRGRLAYLLAALAREEKRRAEDAAR